MKGSMTKIQFRNNMKTSLIALFLVFCIGNILNGADIYTFEPGYYKISRDDEGYDILKMTGFTSMSSPGNPKLPHKIFNIVVPPDIDWTSLKLEIINISTEKLPGVYNIEPVQPDVAWTGNEYVYYWGEGKDIFDGRNRNVYEANAFFPKEILKLLSISQMRKWKFIKVDFSPFRYNPVTGELVFLKQITAKVGYTRTGEKPNQSIMNDSVMDDVARKVFMNYDEAKNWYASITTSEIKSSTYNYVIITTSAIQTNSIKLSDFITHKINRGFSVLVVTETDFGSLTGQSPNHRAEKIREWLKTNYISMGIEYVLLIGDPSPYESGEGDIPMKMCWPRNADISDKESPTDFFYADLTGNWDLDEDEMYGEWSDDYPVIGGVDFSPEVYAGRIPVYSSNYTDLDNILQKIIDYENESGGVSWRKNILLPMSFSTTSYDGAPLAEQMKDDYLITAGYSYWRQYQQGNGTCGLNSLYSSEEELQGGTVVENRWQSNDYGIVCWWGHGSQTSASVGCEGCWDGLLFSSSQCSSLDDYHPSFTYQCSCTNGYPENSNNLGYAPLKQGSIGTVSATRVSWFNTGVGYGDFDGSTTNSGLGYEYTKRLSLNENPAGQALYLTKSGMSPESSTRLMNWFDFNLYGDPSTSITGQDPTHTISTPSTPTGPSSGLINTSYSFTTGGAACSQGHSVEYRFDWGDGSYSDWLSSISTFHSWSAPNTYTVRAQARCATNHSIVSDWSSGFDVTISAPHTISTPNPPNGPSNGYIDTPYPYTTGGSSCSWGHSVEYQFDWGDGSYSSWSNLTNASHSWLATGAYTIRARARCSIENDIISGWSVGYDISIKHSYYLEFPGKGFVPGEATSNWTKSFDNSYLENDSSSSAYFFCPVNFYDGDNYIKNMSVDYSDSSSTGYIRVRLIRRYFPSGTIQTVAEFEGSTPGTPGHIREHFASISGTKYVDTTYYTYWLEVYFSEGNSPLSLYAVRIHYGN